MALPALISRPFAHLAPCAAMRSTIGMKIATTPVEEHQES